jgi:hypothetical protein
VYSTWSDPKSTIPPKLPQEGLKKIEYFYRHPINSSKQRPQEMKIFEEIQNLCNQENFRFPSYWREGDTLRHIYAFDFDKFEIVKVKEKI